MLVEATIMRTRVIILAYEGYISLLSLDRMFSKYRHFGGVENLKNITLPSNLDELESAISKTHLDRRVSDAPEGFDYFVIIFEPSYAAKLLLFVDRLEAYQHNLIRLN